MRLALEASMAWGVRPGKYEKWPLRDRQLAEAYILHRATVNALGVRVEKATDPDTEGWWQVESVEDFSQKALADWREAEGKNSQPWELPRVRLDPNYKPRGKNTPK